MLFFLETSTVDYVIFETAGALKEALIREWGMLDENDILSLRQYLLNYIISKPGLAPFVRERMLQVSFLYIIFYFVFFLLYFYPLFHICS